MSLTVLPHLHLFEGLFLELINTNKVVKIAVAAKKTPTSIEKVFSSVSFSKIIASAISINRYVVMINQPFTVAGVDP